MIEGNKMIPKSAGGIRFTKKRQTFLNNYRKTSRNTESNNL